MPLKKGLLHSSVLQSCEFCPCTQLKPFYVRHVRCIFVLFVRSLYIFENTISTIATVIFIHPHSQLDHFTTLVSVIPNKRCFYFSKTNPSLSLCKLQYIVAVAFGGCPLFAPPWLLNRCVPQYSYPSSPGLLGVPLSSYI